MRLVYVTSSFPYGHGEGFLVAELRELERQGHDVTIVPTLARGPMVHQDARPLLPSSQCSPLLSRDVMRSALQEWTGAPAQSLALLLQLRHSRSARILAKNGAVFSKGLWLAARVREVGAEHIHAHWGATSATLAMVAGRVSGVPWSLTVHRWDIRENNLLRLKAESASFVRAISEDGLRDFERTIGPTRTPRHLLHMGVPLPSRWVAPAERGGDHALRVLVPANFLEVKGHRYLIEAIRLLKCRGTRVVAGLAGEGPLRAEIVRWIAEAQLADECVLLGQISHSELLGALEAGQWDVVALASVETASGDKEGIPVAFLEAMSYALPVVGTAVGGIPELLEGGSGLLVQPRDPVALAGALGRLAGDLELRRRLGSLGRERVERDFSVESVVRELVRHFEASARVEPNAVQLVR
jgi:colanic acid/amylovoran biosynthesis glycosyltransferase